MEFPEASQKKVAAEQPASKITFDHVPVEPKLYQRKGSQSEFYYRIIRYGRKSECGRKINVFGAQ